jgi:hypothetical protein
VWLFVWVVAVLDGSNIDLQQYLNTGYILDKYISCAGASFAQSFNNALFSREVPLLITACRWCHLSLTTLVALLTLQVMRLLRVPYAFLLIGMPTRPISLVP